MAKYLKFIKSRWFIGVSCLILGAAIIVGVRLITYKPATVHYHANFAVYINGQRELFKDASYYTEVQTCETSNSITPSERVHMHDSVNDVVHVEDQAVTWGNFFQNLGWNLGSTYIVNRSGTVYQENGSNKLNLILNGQNYTDLGGLQNKVIEDTDKLLVSFGDNSQATLDQQYASIASTAEHYDQTPDPATCSGHDTVTMHDRLVHMF